jgi:DNA-methyltransferase (dcm)
MVEREKYEFQQNITSSDILADVCMPLFFNNGNRNYNPNSINVLSLFSGCGGMDLGFEGEFICHKNSVGHNKQWIKKGVNENWVLLKKNRFNTIFANDILKEAYHTWIKYMSRFGKNEDIYHLESIVDLVKKHKDGYDIFPKNVDIVTGGFPCQDFSVAGKRYGLNSRTSHDGQKIRDGEHIEENRGKLYYWMKQVIEITKPKLFIAENVKGLVSLGDVKDIIQKDFQSISNNGYYVFNPQVLHAGNYGVPETRERLFFIGVRLDALKEKVRSIFESGNIPDEYNPYPKPTHNYNVGNSFLASPVICKDVLCELKEPNFSQDLSQKLYSQAKYMGTHCQGQSEIDYYGLAPTIRSEHHGNIEFRRLSQEHNGERKEELKKGLQERRLTPRECAMIQTFPPDYSFVQYVGYTKRFLVSSSGAYKVIGNAIPPMLAYNIAKRIEDIWQLYFN